MCFSYQTRHFHILLFIHYFNLSFHLMTMFTASTFYISIILIYLIKSFPFSHGNPALYYMVFNPFLYRTPMYVHAIRYPIQDRSCNGKTLLSSYSAKSSFSSRHCMFFLSHCIHFGYVLVQIVDLTELMEQPCICTFVHLPTSVCKEYHCLV